MTCHIMADIETLGTRVGSVVLSVAFVRFEDLASCNVNLSVPDQQALGMEIDSGTVEWWKVQPPAAWAAATANPQPLAVALPYFATWLQWAAAGRSSTLIWCHGASFDAPLLGEIYRLAGMPCPWKYNAVRDTRTLYDLAGIDLKAYSAGTAHVALDDATCQTKAAIDALRRLQAARRRYFHDPETDGFVFCDDGVAHPNYNEVGPNDYLLGVGYRPVASDLAIGHGGAA